MKDLILINQYIKAKNLTYKLFVVSDCLQYYLVYESTLGKQIEFLSTVTVVLTNLPALKHWVDINIVTPN